MGLAVVRRVARTSRRPVWRSTPASTRVTRPCAGSSWATRCTRPATPEQIEAMVALLHESLRAGALGFSSSLGDAHTDGDGAPVPSRSAQPDEFLALAARRPRPRGHQPRVHPRHGRDLRRAHRAHDRHVARRRPPAQLEPARQRVAHAGVRAAAHLGRPRDRRTARTSSRSRSPTSCACAAAACSPRCRDGARWSSLPDAERRAALADPAVRERLRAGLDAAASGASPG